MTFFQVFVLVVGIGFIGGGVKLFRESFHWSLICFILGFFVVKHGIVGAAGQSKFVQTRIQSV